MIIHLTNWSSRALHGPGRTWSIMARPRRWELGCGQVPVLVPPPADLDAVRTGIITVAEYRARYEAHVLDRDHMQPYLDPGALLGHLTKSVGPMPVDDGDTLCCACAKEAASRGECHRVYAAHILRDHGWSVVLDGRTL